MSSSAGVVLVSLAIVFLNASPQHLQLKRATVMTRGLWKFTPGGSEGDVQLQMLRHWRILQLVGVMLALIVSAMAVLIIGHIRACVSSLVVFVLWMAGISMFWYKGGQRGDKTLASFLGADGARTFVGGFALDDGSGGMRGKEKGAQSDSGGWKRKVKAEKDDRLPVTIITGFLGSGKTTLVKSILRNTVGMKVLVVENEIGAEGIDHDLLMQHTAKEEIILMNNGCICCTVRKDLLTTFHRLFENEAFARLDWVVIETTGLADPAPLIQSLYIDAKCKTMMRLDGVVTVVDCLHIQGHLRQTGGSTEGAHGGLSEAQLQVAFADRILLNKIDLLPQDTATDGGLDDVTLSIRLLNTHAKIFMCEKANVPIDELLNIRAFDASRNQGLLESLRDENAYEILDDRPILIRRDDSGKILRKTVKMNYNPTRAAVDVLAEKHKAKGISTVSLICNEPLDLDLFNEWIASVLRTKGNELYRTKGILWINKYDEQFVAHGVHMIFDGERGPVWPDGKRQSRLVFIGLDLNSETLRREFLACRSI